MSLQDRIDEENKSATWGDIFTPQERQEWIYLREIGKDKEAQELFEKCSNRSFPNQ